MRITENTELVGKCPQKVLAGEEPSAAPSQLSVAYCQAVCWF